MEERCGSVEENAYFNSRECNSLVIWEWVSTNPSFKHIRLVRVLLDWTEIEDPKVLPVSVLEKFDGILSAIAI